VPGHEGAAHPGRPADPHDDGRHGRPVRPHRGRSAARPEMAGPARRSAAA